MAKPGIHLNTKIFFTNLDLVNKRIAVAVERGVGTAMLQLKNDMSMQAPTSPMDEGFLRGSTSIHVQGEELQVPLGPGERADKKVQGYKIPTLPGRIIGMIGINVPYAARWHEVPFTPGGKNRDPKRGPPPAPDSGPKYLESKMANNKMTYRKIIVNAINKASGQ